jgi:hemerythrin
MDEADTALADILADCATDADLERHIMKHATIVQRLACCMVRGQDHAEKRVRQLYSDLADLAVEHIGDSRVFSGRKLH